MAKSGLRWMVLLGALLLVLTGCSNYPADPDGTLKSVTGGTLRVGVTESGQWVELAPDSEPQGIEPDLVRKFADGLGAEIEWIEGSEHEIAEDLKHGELDMAVGGIAGDTPWSTHAGLSRPYVETQDERGDTVKHVMLVPLGENAFLLRLDKFLMQQEVRP